MKLCDFTISHYFRILFILFSYFYHIFGLGTEIRAPQVIFLSYSWSYIFHIIFILLYIPGLGPLSIPQSLKSLVCPISVPAVLCRPQEKQAPGILEHVLIHFDTC